MKIIEAMKKIKDMQAKAEDLRKKVAQYCADMDFETPVYGTEQDQRDRVAEWLQSHTDLMKEILSLRVAIQRTNLQTSVTIDLNGKSATKSIATANREKKGLHSPTLQGSWLTGQGRKDANDQGSQGPGCKDVSQRRKRYGNVLTQVTLPPFRNRNLSGFLLGRDRFSEEVTHDR